MQFEDHIDQIIRQGQLTGAFDDLPGRGKPLAVATMADPVASLLSGAGIVPEWIELARDIERRREEAERFAAEYAAEYAQSRARVERLTAEPISLLSRRGVALKNELAALNYRRTVALERYSLLLREIVPSMRRFNEIKPLERPSTPVPDLVPLVIGFIIRCPKLELAPDTTLVPVSEAIPERLVSIAEPVRARNEVRRRSLTQIREAVAMRRLAGL